jgi:hypothetical protein
MFKLDLNQYIIFKRVNSLYRWLLVYKLQKFLPQIIVTEYPKSGGSWFCQMLSEALNINFPRFKLPRIGTSIIQGHYLPVNSFKNSICVIRDGRDIMISYYFYSFFKNDLYNNHIVKKTLNRFNFKDPQDIKSNLPAFLESQLTKPIYPLFTWPEYIDEILKLKIKYIRYEDLLDNTLQTMVKAINILSYNTPDNNFLEKIIKNYSFERQTGRKRGSESVNSFLRKGVAGDWDNHFTREASEIFNHYAGHTLIKLGYENDNNWVRR